MRSQSSPAPPTGGRVPSPALSRIDPPLETFQSLQRSGRALRRNLRAYPFFYFFFDLQPWLALWVVYLTGEVGLSFLEIGAIAPMFYVLAAFGQAPIGALADRFGRVRTIRAACLLFILFFVVLALSQSVWWAAAAWLAWGFGFASISGADSAFLHDSLQALGRSREFELRAGRVFAMRATAQVTATLAAGALAGLIGMRGVVALGICPVAIALAITFLFREPPRGASGTVRGAEYFRLLRQTLALAWGRREIRYLLIVAALILSARVFEAYLMQPFLISQDVDVDTLFTVLQTPVRLAAIAGALGAFWWARRMGEFRSLGGMPVLVVAIFITLAFADHLAAMAAFVAGGLLQGAVAPLVEGYLNRRVPSRQRATMLSLNHMGWTTIMLFALPIFGWQVDQHPLRLIFFALALIFAAAGAAALLLWLRAHRAAPTPDLAD